MNGQLILDQYRQELSDHLLQWRGDLPQFNPLPINPYLAMSLLQKAIRRGEEVWALRAAATLLQNAPARLWRRLGIIAYEDIGLGDLDAVGFATVVLAGKRYRARIGGEWAVASFLICRMCRAPKCRATDDMFVVCEWNPDLERPRFDLTHQTIPNLLKVVISDASLPERALALWYAAGTAKFPSDQLRERQGEPDAVLDALCDRGFDNGMIEVCREGLRRTGEVLPLFLILLEKEFQKFSSHVEPDDLPEEVMVGGVPGYAFDTFTREGKRAIRMMLEGETEISAWAEENLPSKGRTKVMGGLLFRINSGLVDNRLHWKEGDSLRHMADLSDYGLNPKVAAEGLAIFRRELPKLQEARLSIVGPNL